MDIRPVLISNLAFTHQILDGSLQGLSTEELHRRADGSKISSIASIYVHSVLSEDSILNGILQGQPTIFDSGGWAEKLGVQPSGGLANDDWRDGIHLNDVEVFQQYATAVRAATTDFITNASDDDLARVLQTPLGEQSVVWVLNNFLSWHTIHHLGEICALKGVMGKQGLPF